MKSKYKICKSCNRSNSREDSFCIYCGQPLKSPKFFFNKTSTAYNSEQKSLSSKNMGEIFDSYFLKMLDTIRPVASKYFAFYDYELSCFFYVVTLYYITFLKKDTKDRVFSEVTEIFKHKFTCYWIGKNGNISASFENRNNFYKTIAAEGQLRAEWCMGTESTQPDVRMFIALGDRIYNPECIKDYNNAPVMIRGIDEQLEFFMTMNATQEILRNYIKEFGELD